MNLQGRTAIVTGSSRGMGATTVAHLARLGAAVAVCYNTAADAAQRVADGIRRDGGTAEVFQSDLTSPEGAESLVAAATDTLGPPDILVCNVGGFLRKAFEETSVEEWRAQFAQNTDTMFFCIRAVLPGMKERSFGRIVTFSAAGAEFPARQRRFTAYAAAKAGVVAMTRALAPEVAEHGVTVNCVAPGIVSDNAPTRADAVAIGHVKHTPVGRVGAAEDVAEAVAYLVRPEADYITGAVLEVGGGWRL